MSIDTTRFKKKIDDMDKVHELQLELLSFFDDVCKKNNLRYFLAGGTLLGAVRHKGFIPWDDDIDLAMPRDDYEKFLKLAPTLPEEYRVLIPAKTPKFHLVFAKIVNKYYYNDRKDLKGKYGIRMDLFPLDGMGNDEKTAMKHAKKLFFLKGIYSLSFRDNIFSKLLYMTRIHKLVYRRLAKKFNKYNFDESKYAGSVVGGLKRYDEIFEYRVYSEPLIMNFESIKVPGMKYYDEYLTKLYGDYMKLPPKEKRVPVHDLDIYDMRESE